MIRHPSVRALFFDADDVLYHRPAHDTCLSVFLERRGMSLPSTDHIRQAIAPVAIPAKLGAIPRDALYNATLAACGVAEHVMVEGCTALATDVALS